LVKFNVGTIAVPVKVGLAIGAFEVFSVERCEKSDVALGSVLVPGVPDTDLPYKKYFRAVCMFATSSNDGIAVLKAESSGPISSAIF
jgi:hypothetical protein